MVNGLIYVQMVRPLDQRMERHIKIAIDEQPHKQLWMNRHTNKQGWKDIQTNMDKHIYKPTWIDQQPNMDEGTHKQSWING